MGTSVVQFKEIARKEPCFFRDVLPFFAPTVMFIVQLVYYQISPNGNALIVSWALYAFTPIYNMFFMNDSENVKKENERRFADSVMFLMPLYSIVIVNFLAWIYCLMLYSDQWTDYKEINQFMFQRRPQSFADHQYFLLGLSFMIGASGTAGHELVHRRNVIHKILGNVPFVQSMYTIFWTEHVDCHHKHVATPHDPVSHPRYRRMHHALFNAYVYSHTSTWYREEDRIREEVMKEKGREPNCFELVFKNHLFHYFIGHMCMFAVIYHVFGVGGLYFQLWYNMAGVVYVESVGYLEHYGLQRRKIGDLPGNENLKGEEAEAYEEINSMHSWNQDCSSMFFKLQRHSDHHQHGFRPYQILRHSDDAPTLPYEYTLMFWLSLCPPLWDYIMDPRLDAVYRAINGEKRKDGKQEDQWCYKMPMSPDDRTRDRIAKLYFVFISILFTAFTWARGL